MTNSLEARLAAIKHSGRKALIPFVTAQYPDRERFQSVVRAIAESGADVIEIGFPHSDPLADGPVIQHASHVAIENGFRVESTFAWMGEFSKEHEIPLVVMCYSNLIMRYGMQKFVKRGADSGVKGLIVPDMIIEESGELRELCAKSDISFINLVTPTTEAARANEIADLSSGFVYVVSVTGTTGARVSIGNGVQKLVRQLKKRSDLSVCVGFGIASPEMAGEVSEYCDGVIIGSKLLDIIAKDESNGEYPQLREFLLAVKSKLGENR